MITTRLYRRVGELSAVLTEVSQARLKNGDLPKSPSLYHRHGGKGKYEGAKGEGTLTGVRVPGLATGVDRYDDIVINVKK